MTDPQPEPHSNSRWFASPWLALASVLFIVMHLWQFDRYPIDGDELFSIKTIERDWSGMFRAAAKDFSAPPLSFAAEKLWVDAGGDGFRWIKLHPTLFGLITLIPIVLAARALGLKPHEAALGVALVGSSFFVLNLMHWARMYAPYHFFAAWGLYFLAKAVNETRLSMFSWFGWLLVSVCMVYCHYWGFLVLAAEFVVLALLARRHLLRFLGMGVVVCVCYSPWVYAILQARGETGTGTKQIEWIDKPTPMELIWLFDTLNGRIDFPHSTKIGVLVFAAVVAGFFVTRRREPSTTRLFGICLPLIMLPVLITYIVSTKTATDLIKYLPNSVWAARALLSIAVPYFLLIAVAAFRLPAISLRAIAVVFVLGWVVTATVLFNLGKDEKPHWDQIVTRIKAESPPGEGPIVVYTFNPHFTWILEWYDTRLGGRPFELHTDSDLSNGPRQFWVLNTVKEWDTHKHTRSPKDHLREQGYTIQEGFEVELRQRTWQVFSVKR